MSDKDFAVSTVGLLPQVGKISNKPHYLITLTNKSKTKPLINFIATDKPDIQMGYISVKGIYCDQSDEEITSKYSEILSNTPKETILDIMFPNHRVHCIRSLMFNAHKPATLNKS
jgi:hypothetical protein